MTLFHWSDTSSDEKKGWMVQVANASGGQLLPSLSAVTCSFPDGSVCFHHPFPSPHPVISWLLCKCKCLFWLHGELDHGNIKLEKFSKRKSFPSGSLSRKTRLELVWIKCVGEGCTGHSGLRFFKCTEEFWNFKISYARINWSKVLSGFLKMDICAWVHCCKCKSKCAAIFLMWWSGS